MNWEKVGLLCLDFDGVVTDSTKWYDEGGMALKRADGRDGMGCFMVNKLLGIPICVVSNEDSPITRQWCQKQYADFRHAGYEVGKDKIVVDLTTELNIPLDHVCFIGDDITDLCALNVVGFPVVVADAHPFLLNRGFYTTTKGGGRGAIREVCDLIYFNRKCIELAGLVPYGSRRCPLWNRDHSSTIDGFHECCRECPLSNDIGRVMAVDMEGRVRGAYKDGA